MRDSTSVICQQRTRKYLYCSHCLDEESQMLWVCIVTRALGELCPPAAVSWVTRRCSIELYSCLSFPPYRTILQWCVLNALRHMCLLCVGGGIEAKPARNTHSCIVKYYLPKTSASASDIWFDSGQRRDGFLELCFDWLIVHCPASIQKIPN